MSSTIILFVALYLAISFPLATYATLVASRYTCKTRKLMAIFLLVWFLNPIIVIPWMCEKLTPR